MAVILIISFALIPIFFAEIGSRLYDLFPFKSGKKTLKVGDKIVYNKTKFSMNPGSRARQILPCEQGENYTYVVEKYWVVADLLPDGRLVAKTRTGKLNYLRPQDTNLHKAGIVEKVLHHDRFPDLAIAA